VHRGDHPDVVGVPSIDLFLAHGAEDTAAAEALADRLGPDVRVWLDVRSLLPGDQWPVEIPRAQRAALATVILHSRRTDAAYYVRDEIHTAIARHRAAPDKHRVVVVFLDGRPADPAQIPYGLGVLHSVDVPAEGGLDGVARKLRDLVAILRGREVSAGSSPPTPPASGVDGTSEPRYESDEVRVASLQLEVARRRLDALRLADADTRAVETEILDLRRRLRLGGQLRAGDTLAEGRFLLLEVIGRGGFGSVWRARDHRSASDVAIKVLHPDVARDGSRRERFFRGARVMSELEHPAIVRVLEPRAEDEGYFYYVMELVDGGDLHRAILTRRLSGARGLALVRTVGEALAHAHARGVVHRDVKPANILVDTDLRPRLTDFDLVRADTTTGGTRTGALGTYLFAAPEQMLHAGEVDARADVYGLGMTALFCLYGSDLTPALVHGRPDKLIDGLACARELKAALKRAIKIEPERRFQDMASFCDALPRAEVLTEPPGDPARLVATPQVGPTTSTSPVSIKARTSSEPAAPGADNTHTASGGPSAQASAPATQASAPAASARTTRSKPSHWLFGGLLGAAALFAAWLTAPRTPSSQRTQAASSPEAAQAPAQPAVLEPPAPASTPAVVVEKTPSTAPPAPASPQATSAEAVVTHPPPAATTTPTPQPLHRCDVGNLDDCRIQCKLGQAGSCNNLAVTYVRSAGAAAHATEIGQLYTTACDANVRAGCYNLGHCYEDGRCGFERDLGKAVSLYKKTCDAGYEDACTSAKRLAVCTPGAKRCGHSVFGSIQFVSTCNESGTDWVQGDVCPSGCFGFGGSAWCTRKKSVASPSGSAGAPNAGPLSPDRCGLGHPDGCGPGQGCLLGECVPSWLAGDGGR